MFDVNKSFRMKAFIKIGKRGRGKLGLWLIMITIILFLFNLFDFNYIKLENYTTVSIDLSDHRLVGKNLLAQTIHENSGIKKQRKKKHAYVEAVNNILNGEIETVV